MAKWAKEHGLLLANLALFVIFFGGMTLSGAATYNEEQQGHGQATVTFLQYIGTSRFWFESFQDWQSEFLAIAVLVGASVYLREKVRPSPNPLLNHTTRPAPEPAR
jgi:prolipoprotein diacylglyceryltransferase